MAWYIPFRTHDKNTRTAWGYTFQWTSQHWLPEQMHPLKFSYDTLGEEALNAINNIKPPIGKDLPRSSTGTSSEDNVDATRDQKPKRDLYFLLRDNAEKDKSLGRLWDQVNTIPEWVDWAQVERGQKVFYRYGGPALTGLAYQSLLGGMGAARVVETLARTGGFSTKVARHRLFETTQHILQCTISLESVKPGGAGFASSIRVRLLHAAVRQRIMALTKQRPEYYDLDNWGTPINDLDSIATIGTFSATLIWLSFPRQGIWLREQEIRDYIALWRLIAHYVGAPTEPFETPEKARYIMESLLFYEVEPSETSKILAKNIIKSLANQPPGFASSDFLVAGARWLNGNELVDRLGLPRPSLWYWILMAGQCIFFAFICYLYRSVPVLDRRKIKALRRIFYAIIVEHKHGLGQETNFEFKYIPNFDVKTELGETAYSGHYMSAVERRSVLALLVASAVLAGSIWLSLKMSSAFLRRILE